MSSSNKSNMSTKSNKSVSASASTSVASSGKSSTFKEVLTRNIAKATARMSAKNPIAEVVDIPKSITVANKSPASKLRKSYAAAVTSGIPNPYRKVLPHNVMPSPPADPTPPTPPTAILATQVSQEVRFYPTPPESVDPKPTKEDLSVSESVTAEDKVITDNSNGVQVCNIVSEEKVEKQVSLVATKKRDRSSDQPTKPSPSEYEALYNAGPTKKKRRGKQQPRKSSESAVKSKAPQLPTRASVAAKKDTKPPTPPLPDLNATITRLSSHFDSEDVHSEDIDSDDSESVETFLKRVRGGDEKKSPVESDKASSKKHSSDNYIKSKALVRASIRTFCNENGRYALESRKGMVLGPIGKGAWRVAFFGDTQYSREMSSNRLTLLRNDSFDSHADDNKSDDEVKFLHVKKSPVEQPSVKQVRFKNESEDTVVKEEEDESDNIYWDFLDADNERKESDISRKRRAAQAIIDAQAGTRYTITAGKNRNADSITWTLVKDDYQARHNLTWNTERRQQIGIKSAGIRNFLNSSDLPLAHLFLYLANPDGDATPVVARMNKAVEEDNTKKASTSADLTSSSQSSSDRDIDEPSEPDGFTPLSGTYGSKARLTKYFDLKDLLTFYALFIGAADASARGCQLWSCGSRHEFEAQEWTTLVPQVDFGIWMKYTRFKELKRYFARAWENPARRADDPWWQVSSAIEQFNWIRKHLLDFSNVIVFDEIMSGFRPRTTEKGCQSPAPHLTFNKDKPCKMGHQAHNGSCGGTKSIGYLDLDRGAEGNKILPYFKELGASASCCKRIVDGMSQMGVNEDTGNQLIIADSWFGNMGSMRALTQVDPMTGRRRDVIFSIKQGYALFPKKQIEALLKDATPGCHAIFRGFDRTTEQHLWAIGWKFNSSTKCLKFLATETAGSIGPSPNPYKIRFPDQFGNLVFRNIPRPGIVDNYYRYNNVIDVHNNYRQHNLGLEKKWITFNPMFRWLTTLTALHVTDCYYLARHHNLLGPLRNVGGSPITITQFAGVLSRQLLTLSQRQSTYDPRIRLPAFDPRLANQYAGEHSFVDSFDDEDEEQFIEDEDEEDLPDIERSPNAIIAEIRYGAYDVKGYMLDDHEKTHTVCLVHTRTLRGSGKKYRNPHMCSLCKKKNTIVFCMECKRAFCYPLRRRRMNDADIEYQQMNSCFQRHIELATATAKRSSPRKGRKSKDDGYESAQV